MMEKLNIVVNPIYEDGDRPGQALEFSIQIPSDTYGIVRSHLIKQKVLDRLRWTIQGDHFLET